MTRHPRFVWIITVALGLALACGPLSNGSSPSPTGSTSSSSKSTSGPASNATGESATQSIPLTPNPLNVQITLDTAKAQTWESSRPFYGQTANGTTFNLRLPEDLVSLEADGSMVPAYGTPVTLTPVATIEGIPFSQGFLAAVHLAPEGLIMVAPGILALTIPAGEYDPATLVGFAADGNGANFHLYPVKISASPVGLPGIIPSCNGCTEVTFDVLHFSVYGVAQATVQEILSQHKRIPQGETAQDEDLLSPLTPDNLSPLVNEHNTNILPKIDVLDKLEGTCNKADEAAKEFITWYTNVKRMGGLIYFKDSIDHDTLVLSSSLYECMVVDCPPCMNETPGDTKAARSFLVHAGFAAQIATIAGKGIEASRWRELANACALNAEIPTPHREEGGCGADCGVGATSTPPVCPP